MLTSTFRDIGRMIVRSQELHQLLIMSIYFIVYYLVSGEERERMMAISYLAICCGLFGRLSLERHEGSVLNSFLDLIEVARSI